jgi:antitoxin HicB
VARNIDYPFVVRPLDRDEGGGYLVEFPDLPGCMADGATPEAAIRESRDALTSWLKTMRALRRPVPRPASASTYSGKWQMRVPRSLHRRLAERARSEGVSLNALALTLMAEGLGRRTKTAA